MATGFHRDDLIRMDDAELLRLCRVDTFRGTGRGGQKRNVTESAVRVTHLASGLAAASDETRSQIQNRAKALHLLRHRMALDLREPVSLGAPPVPRPVSRKGSEYLLWLAHTLDALDAAGYRVSEAAAACGSSTGRLVRDLADDPQAWQHVNQRRQALGMNLLRRD